MLGRGCAGRLRSSFAPPTPIWYSDAIVPENVRVAESAGYHAPVPTYGPRISRRTSLQKAVEGGPRTCRTISHRPARKVIPYKKGGRRQSPFTGMAFRFNGTALDVAIQQREQEGGEPLLESSAEAPLSAEFSTSGRAVLRKSNRINTVTSCRRTPFWPLR